MTKPRSVIRDSMERRFILDGAKEFFTKYRGMNDPEEYKFISFKKIEAVRLLTAEYQSYLTPIKHKITVDEEKFA